MTKDEKAARTAATIEKADFAIRLIWAGGLLILGLGGMVATVSGSLFANADNSQSNGWLYQNLGKEGASIAAFVLFAVLALVGGFLTRRLIQKLGQMYEDSTR